MELQHMMYLAEGGDPDDETMSDVYVLCASEDSEHEAWRIVVEGRMDNLPDITCPDCRALMLGAASERE
jgi:hypothetical protein